jgi:phytoene dehydrogenase-like protein
MEEKWDVIIIGAGCAGLCTGALLAHAGKKVLVLEKRGVIGGRVTLANIQGFMVDGGGHWLCLGDRNAVSQVLVKIGKPPMKFAEKIMTALKIKIYDNGKWRNLRELFSREEFKTITSEIIETSYEELTKYDDISFKDWLLERTKNEGLHIYFRIVGTMLLGLGHYEDVSAGEILYIMKENMENKHRMMSLEAPVGMLYTQLIPLADAIKEKGGEVRFNTKVTNVIIENGFVQGVEVEKGERLFPMQILYTERIEAPIVVCTVPLWDFFKIVSEDDLPSWFVSWVDRIRYKVAQSWTFIAGLEEPLWEGTEGRGVWELPRARLEGFVAFHQTIFDPSVAPPGKHQFYAAFGADYKDCPYLLEPELAKNRKLINKKWDDFEADLLEFFPGLNKCLWKVRIAGFAGIAYEPGMVGKHRPDIEVPGVKGLYLAGDTVRARGVAADISGRTAMKCAERILSGK